MALHFNCFLGENYYTEAACNWLHLRPPAFTFSCPASPPPSCLHVLLSGFTSALLSSLSSPYSPFVALPACTVPPFPLVRFFLGLLLLLVLPSELILLCGLCFTSGSRFVAMILLSVLPCLFEHFLDIPSPLDFRKRMLTVLSRRCCRSSSLGLVDSSHASAV